MKRGGGMSHRGMFRRKVGGIPLLLDDYPAFAAWSVRKLRSAYSGYCMEVENIDSGGTLDVGFDVDGLIDTTAILSWAGSDSVGVRTFYDQVGSNDLIQTTPANQPIISNAGTIITINSKPSLRCENGTSYMSVLSSTATFKFLHDGTKSATLNVIQNDLTSPRRSIVPFGTSVNASASIGVTQLFPQGVTFNRIQPTINRGVPTQSISATLNSYANNVQNIVFTNYDANNATTSNKITFHLNGSGIIANASGNYNGSSTDSAKDFYLFGFSGNASNFSGYGQELIVWDDDQSANDTVIVNEVNSYYSTF